MAGYAADKDKVVAEIGSFPGGKNTTIEITLCSYDNGEPKLNIKRIGNNGSVYKLGRLTIEEAFKLVQLLQEHRSVIEDSAIKALRDKLQ